jgi:hypothetical protein
MSDAGARRRTLSGSSAEAIDEASKTPTMVVDNEVMIGFDLDRLEHLLG